MTSKLRTGVLVLLLGLVLGIGTGCQTLQDTGGPFLKSALGALGEFSISTSALNLGPVGLTYGIREGRIQAGVEIGAVPLICLALNVIPDFQSALCDGAATMSDGSAHHAPWSLPQPASVPVDPDRPPNRSPTGEIVAYNAFSAVGVEAPQDWYPRLE